MEKNRQKTLLNDTIMKFQTHYNNAMKEYNSIENRLYRTFSSNSEMCRSKPDADLFIDRIGCEFISNEIENRYKYKHRNPQGRRNDD